VGWNNAYAGYHGGWVHGYWNGHYPGWGWGGYGLGVATGLAAWGLGSALYSGWGYSDYYNPYYDAQMLASQPVAVAQAPYDYAQPIDTTAAEPESSVADAALGTFDQARESFRTGDYAKALDLTNQALKSIPNDATIHQFRALCLFALKRYDEAAAALYAVLSVSPGWDWTTMISLYSDASVYTEQLRALESAIAANRQSASARFVLAYHYMTQGNNDDAAQQFKAVAQLLPKDKLTAQLLQAMTKTQAEASSTEGTPAEAINPARAQTEAAQASKLPGIWTASPSKGSTITLTLSKEGAFSWSFSAKGKAHKIEGKTAYESDVLTLAPSEEAQPMVGQLKWQDDNHFTFQAQGGGPSDPGLSFVRSS
jgi:tetratricopeptide (TPR) repeat protein